MFFSKSCQVALCLAALCGGVSSSSVLDARSLSDLVGDASGDVAKMIGRLVDERVAPLQMRLDQLELDMAANGRHRRLVNDVDTNLNKVQMETLIALLDNNDNDVPQAVKSTLTPEGISGFFGLLYNIVGAVGCIRKESDECIFGRKVGQVTIGGGKHTPQNFWFGSRPGGDMMKINTGSPKGAKGDLGMINIGRHMPGGPGDNVEVHVQGLVKARHFSPKGMKGDQGDKGDPGMDGMDGDKGDPGMHGDKGDPGMDGDKGDPGMDGDKGDPGMDGDKGDPGMDGDKGDPGMDGDKGDPGMDGDKGDPGMDGDKGDPGMDGDKGDPGMDGDKGDPGMDGVKGDPGMDGDKGDPGMDGDKGDPGMDGDKGDPGMDGVKGDPGTNGMDGVKGDPGTNGMDGVKGDPGADGPKGDAGTEGPKGDAGPKGDTGDDLLSPCVKVQADTCIFGEDATNVVIGGNTTTVDVTNNLKVGDNVHAGGKVTDGMCLNYVLEGHGGDVCEYGYKSHGVDIGNEEGNTIKVGKGGGDKVIIGQNCAEDSLIIKADLDVDKSTCPHTGSKTKSPGKGGSGGYKEKKEKKTRGWG